MKSKKARKDKAVINDIAVVAGVLLVFLALMISDYFGGVDNKTSLVFWGLVLLVICLCSIVVGKPESATLYFGTGVFIGCAISIILPLAINAPIAQIYTQHTETSYAVTDDYLYSTLVSRHCFNGTGIEVNKTVFTTTKYWIWPSKTTNKTSYQDMSLADIANISVGKGYSNCDDWGEHCTETPVYIDMQKLILQCKGVLHNDTLVVNGVDTKDTLATIIANDKCGMDKSVDYENVSTKTWLEHRNGNITNVVITKIPKNDITNAFLQCIDTHKLTADLLYFRKGETYLTDNPPAVVFDNVVYDLSGLNLTTSSAVTTKTNCGTSKYYENEMVVCWDDHCSEPSTTCHNADITTTPDNKLLYVDEKNNKVNYIDITSNPVSVYITGAKGLWKFGDEYVITVRDGGMSNLG